MSGARSRPPPDCSSGRAEPEAHTAHQSSASQSTGYFKRLLSDEMVLNRLVLAAVRDSSTLARELSVLEPAECQGHAATGTSVMLGAPSAPAAVATERQNPLGHPKPLRSPNGLQTVTNKVKNRRRKFSSPCAYLFCQNRAQTDRAFTRQEQSRWRGRSSSVTFQRCSEKHLAHPLARAGVCSTSSQWHQRQEDGSAMVWGKRRSCDPVQSLSDDL